VAQIRSKISLVVKILIAVGLIYYLVHSGHLDLSKVWDLITVPNVIIALVLAAFTLGLSAWRWIVLLKARDFNIPVGYGCGLYLIGMFFNYALPGSVSGDLVRGYYLVQDYPARKMDGALSVLIDRILGLYSFFILTLVAVIWDFNFVLSHEKIRLIAALSIFLFAGMTVFFLLGFSPRIYRLSHLDFIIRRIGPLQKVMTGFQRFGQNRRVLALSVFVSILAQCATLVFFYGIGVLMHEPALTWQAVLFVVPMGFVVTAIPLAPAGVGVGQVAFLYLFQTYMGSNTQYGAVSITAFQLATAVWSMMGIIFYLRRRKPHELENLETTMETAGA
jgi:glycosyltransferase 2 family protein